MESQTIIKPKFRPNPDVRLMDQVREVLRYIHHFGGKTYPNRLGDKDGEQYLSPLENGVNIRVLQELLGHAEGCEDHRDLYPCHVARYQTAAESAGYVAGLNARV